MKTMRRLKHLFLVIVVVFIQLSPNVMAQNPKLNLQSNRLDGYNFIIANDLGRNGYYDQKTIAQTMGEWAGKASVEFVAAVGDIHHFNGVASVTDPLWMTNYELIYSHPELMLDWYPVLGNHEYRGNTQAVLDYAKVSRRWTMPARYYTLVKKVDDKSSIRLIFIDTTPLIDKYRSHSEEYPDACKQDRELQLHFIDSVLSVNKEKWTIVLGHHPVYAQTKKDDSERNDMQNRLDPLLKKYKVDFYVCGHIHNFQHIKQKSSSVDYFVNSSASGSRKVEAVEGTQFCSDKSGFSICSVTQNKLTIYFMDKEGNEIYSYTKTK
ncbi:MAG: metallophosphoesterase [Bacteroidales bacterium]